MEMVLGKYKQPSGDIVRRQHQDSKISISPCNTVQLADR